MSSLAGGEGCTKTAVSLRVGVFSPTSTQNWLTPSTQGVTAQRQCFSWSLYLSTNGSILALHKEIMSSLLSIMENCCEVVVKIVGNEGLGVIGRFSLCYYCEIIQNTMPATTSEHRSHRGSDQQQTKHEQEQLKNKNNFVDSPSLWKVLVEENATL